MIVTATGSVAIPLNLPDSPDEHIGERESIAFVISITRADLGGANPGSYDSTRGSPTFGTYLHLRQVAPLGVELTAGTEGEALLCEWSPRGIEVFHKCPKLELIGGSGKWSVSVKRARLPGGYLVREKRLSRILLGGTSFVIPPGHTGIGCLDQTATLTNVDEAAPLVLSAPLAYDIPSGTTILAGRNPVNLFTSFDL